MHTMPGIDSFFRSKLCSAISNDGKATALCLKSGDCILTHPMLCNVGRSIDRNAKLCAFSPNGTRCAVITSGNGIVIYNVSTGAMEYDLNRIFSPISVLINMCFCPDNNTLIIVVATGVLSNPKYNFISVNINQPKLITLFTHETKPQAIAVAEDISSGKLKIAIIDNENKLCIYYIGPTDVAPQPSCCYQIKPSSGNTKIYDCVFVKPDTIRWADETGLAELSGLRETEVDPATLQTRSWVYNPIRMDGEWMTFDDIAISFSGEIMYFYFIQLQDKLARPPKTWVREYKENHPDPQLIQAISVNPVGPHFTVVKFNKHQLPPATQLYSEQTPLMAPHRRGSDNNCWNCSIL